MPCHAVFAKSANVPSARRSSSLTAPWCVEPVGTARRRASRFCWGLWRSAATADHLKPRTSVTNRSHVISERVGRRSRVRGRSTRATVRQAPTRDDDLRLLDIRPSDRDPDDARTLGRGPGDSRQSNADEHSRDPRDDARWPDPDREPPDRAFDPREPFTRDLNLPRGLEREVARGRDRECTLRGSETRTLATIGAFRVVSSRDLRDYNDRPTDPRSGDLRHLREQGLIKTVRVPGSREHAVALTKEGRTLLEHHRDRDHGGRQTFRDGLEREREREHDLQTYRACEKAAERLDERGARIDRIMLDHELKRRLVLRRNAQWFRCSDNWSRSRASRPRSADGGGSLDARRGSRTIDLRSAEHQRRLAGRQRR